MGHYISPLLILLSGDAALYTEKLLRQFSLAQMWTVAKLKNGQPNSGHYGFGWFIVSQDGQRLFEHEGAWQGFKAQISRYVDDKLTVIVLANLDSADPAAIAHGIAKIYLNSRRPVSPSVPVVR